MKCLEKDRSRRYSSPAALAEDLQRHLKGEPVVARPEHGLSSASLFGEIRWRPAASLVAHTVLGIIGTSVGLANANEQRERAEEQAKLGASGRGSRKDRGNSNSWRTSSPSNSTRLTHRPWEHRFAPTCSRASARGSGPGLRNRSR